MIASVLKRIFHSDPHREAAHEAYVHIVSQSRHPVFFQDWQVADTVDGRFDVILLHLSLVIHCIESQTQDDDSKLFVRTLSEVFFSDMDRSLRELGASDTGVGIRIKKMAQAFYGRLKSYSDTLESSGDIASAIGHNIYRDDVPLPAILEKWSDYCVRNREHLQKLEIQTIMAGHVSFAEPASN